MPPFVRPDARPRPASRRLGFTIVELLLVLAILGVLASLAFPALWDVLERARVARAMGDLRALQIELSQLDSLPHSLAAIGRAGRLDPWGNPYVYNKLAGSRGVGSARKSRFLVPLNTDYDLYSVGKDGASSAPLTAKASRDDVIRANNGAYIGLASKY